MPTLVLFAGPIGAGKTTFIGRFLKLRAETFMFVNPDEVVERASSAGSEDGAEGTYDPDDKLSSDTDDQKEAYDSSWNKAQS